MRFESEKLLLGFTTMLQNFGEKTHSEFNEILDAILCGQLEIYAEI